MVPLPLVRKIERSYYFRVPRFDPTAGFGMGNKVELPTLDAVKDAPSDLVGLQAGLQVRRLLRVKVGSTPVPAQLRRRNVTMGVAPGGREHRHADVGSFEIFGERLAQRNYREF